MNLRSLSVLSVAALSLVLTACPAPTPTPDASVASFDGGNPPAQASCAGGCAANQVCDTARRTCVDACGGCDAGLCVKVSEGVFQCRERAVTCGADLCEPGQIACLGGSCACLSSLSGALDTCEVAGKWCNGGTCVSPKALQQCRPGDATAPCPSGFTCNTQLFADDIGTCNKNCDQANNNNDCPRGELCSQIGCLPAGLFSNQECNQGRPAPDGGWLTDDAGVPLRLTVPVGNTCLLKDANGAVTEANGKGTGNCSYSIFQLWKDGVYPFETCRPPGNATEGQPCRDDYSQGTLATQCGTGLQCAKTRGGDDGVCLRMCNAQPAALGFNPSPECNTDESCVNQLRYTDPNSNSVLGVCMKKCNVFDATRNTCANVGSSASSCVPTEASGALVVTPNGDGICVPQRTNIAALNGECPETDAFRGAACASAQMCSSLSADVKASCTGVCDLECNAVDGGTGPARCATEPSARCAAGKRCTRVTSTTGARVGFCL